MKNKVILVKGYKWQGLYVNNILVDQYSSISDETIKQYLQDGGDYRIFRANNDWLNHVSYFPETYDRVWFEGERWK